MLGPSLSSVCPLPFSVTSLLSHSQCHFFHDIWIVSLNILQGITESFANAGDVSYCSIFGRPIISNGFSFGFIAPSSLLICNLVLDVTPVPCAPLHFGCWLVAPLSSSITAGRFLGFRTPGFCLGLLGLVSFIFLRLALLLGKEDVFDV